MGNCFLTTYHPSFMLCWWVLIHFDRKWLMDSIHWRPDGWVLINSNVKQQVGTQQGKNWESMNVSAHLPSQHGFFFLLFFLGVKPCWDFWSTTQQYPLKWTWLAGLFFLFFSFCMESPVGILVPLQIGSIYEGMLGRNVENIKRAKQNTHTHTHTHTPCF